MPRTLSGALQTHLNGSMLTLATCCLIQRRDGVSLGFTSLDRDLTIGSQLYEAFSAVDASAVRQSEGSGIDNLDVVGLVTSNRIVDVDILAGLYDAADVSIFQVNWSDLTQGTVPLLTGTIGEITEREGEYTAEIRSLSQRLAQQVGQLTAPLCRVRAFGDSECIPPGDPLTTLVLAGYQFTRTVSVVTSATQLTFAAEPSISNHFRYGRVQFLTGPNTGLAREVKAHTLSGGTALITLQEAFPFVVSVGNTAMLEAGCDRTIGRCGFFSNTINFQAEPHLPGNWLVLRRGRR